MQGFKHMAITDVVKTKLRCNFDIKITKSMDREIYMSRVLRQCACLKGMSRTFTMQGFTRRYH